MTTLTLAPTLPGLEARPDAMAAAAQLRKFISDRNSFGKGVVAHINMRPRSRSCLLQTWSTIPLTLRVDRSGSHRSHALLPKWEYSWEELQTEMLPDLETLASTGKQPMQATR